MKSGSTKPVFRTEPNRDEVETILRPEANQHPRQVKGGVALHQLSRLLLEASLRREGSQRVADPKRAREERKDRAPRDPHQA
jgi:hypothetical protein